MWVHSFPRLLVGAWLLCLMLSHVGAGTETTTPISLPPTEGPPPASRARSQLRQVLQVESRTRPAPTPARPPAPSPSAPVVTPVPRPRLAAGWDIPSPAPTPEPEPSPTAEPTQDTAADVVVMAPIAVVEKKDTALRARIQEKEEERVHLLKSIEKIENSVLDKILNSPAIAIFGGSSTENRVREIEARLAFLEQEIHLLKALDQATTLQEREAIGRSLRELYHPPRGKP